MHATATSADELIAALHDPGLTTILVSGTITGAPTLRLAPGQRLIGKEPGARIAFAPGVDGLQLTTENQVRGLTLQASPERRAIWNDTTVSSLGTIALYELTTSGQVQIIAQDRVRGGHVVVDGLDVIAADARERPDRPAGYGVHVLQGAFTLYNLQPDPAVFLTAELLRISVGREGAPVLGSGVFVSGQSDAGGRVLLSRLETGAVCTDGRIEPGTAGLITGGVFVLHGVTAEEVRNRGPVTTHGVNDMVLDNWGIINRWVAEAPITSHGPSGVGFVNFGPINELAIRAPVETFGRGARGFNVYAGQVARAEFHSITTHGDAGVGVQVSKPLGRLLVHHGIRTEGGTGGSLVKGVIKQLPAYGISVLAGGEVGEIEINGGLMTTGDGVVSLRIEGEVRAMRVYGGVRATGQGSDAILIAGGTAPLTNLDVTAADGVAVRLKGANLTAMLGVAAHGSAGDVVTEDPT